VIELQKCSECNGLLITRDGETTCSQCGLVVHEEKIINDKDYSYYNESTVRHSGSSENINIHDKGLPTSISKTNHDAWGRTLKNDTKIQMARLRRLQLRGMNNGDRTLSKGLGQINLICDKSNLPFSVRSRSSAIFRDVLAKGLIKGRSIISIASAAVYFTCREEQVVRSLEDIAQVSGTNKKEVARVYRFLLKNVVQLNKLQPYNFTKYINKIGSSMKISGEKQGDAIRLLLFIQQKTKHLAGKDPKGLAAAALYIVCKDDEKIHHKIIQKDLAIAVNVTEVTVRNRYKDLRREMIKLGMKIE
jgi:transcription initiation factor TFIIB